MTSEDSRPQTVFICGAVGSGNTFMFNCLTQDDQVYGVNEDAFGSTLQRLINSEREMGKCPHAVRAFSEFISALRAERKTLILKTPSNLRHARVLLEHFPRSRFITMLREPHAAITSGIERHESKASIEENARRWLRDCKELYESRDHSILVTFEDLVRDPMRVMRRINDTLFPLSDDVMKYADRMHRPDRSDPNRWKAKVGPETGAEIEKWVSELKLTEQYENVIETYSSAGDSNSPASRHPAVTSVGPLGRLRSQFFRLRYRLLK